MATVMQQLMYALAAAVLGGGMLPASDSYDPPVDAGGG